MDARVCFVRASGQNVYFEEITEALRAALERGGLVTEVAVDHFPPPAPDLVYVFVPHEYLPLTYPRAHPTDGQIRRSVVLATEQPGTTWFGETAAVAARAGATVDMNELGVAELRRRGINARPMRLGYVPEWDVWHGAQVERPIDVMFLGGYTRRRGRALAACGRVLHRHRTAIHLANNDRPQTAGTPGFLVGEEKYRRLAASRLLVNVHRDDYGYLEWARVLEAISNGCVVLTEHAFGFAPLTPGEHFVSTSLETLPFVLEELLADEQRLRSIASAAYELVRERLSIEDAAAVLAEAVESAVRQQVRADGAVPRASAPAPKPPPGPRPVWQRLEDEPFEWRQLRSAVKRVALDQRRLERRMTAMLEPHAKDAVEIEHYGPRGAETVRVTVALTVFNYGHLVGEAISSVARAAGDEIELVVIDDASTDDSAAVVLRALHAAPWLRTTFLRRRTNAGLPAARNLAISHARGEYVFVLDADNTVYENGIQLLTAALEEHSEAAFAYGILEKFDGSGPVDVMSWEPWVRDRFKYGNYIDAMSMLRRSAVERVGGFPTDERLYGWEDFALWCAFAQARMPAVFVPEIVGRYRAGPLSMITVTEIDTSEAWALLTELYPFLREPNEAS